MKTIEEVLTTYFKAWNAPNLNHITELLEESWTPTFEYIDPMFRHRNVGELAERIAKARAEAPTFWVDFTTAADGFDDTFRYGWVFVRPETKLSLPGFDVVTRGKDGRITALTSFFGVLESIHPGQPLRTQRRFGT